ncbi:hypothetical protein SGLAM104S_09822 [Streptomyces glaucescens]
MRGRGRRCVRRTQAARTAYARGLRAVYASRWLDFAMAIDKQRGRASSPGLSRGAIVAAAMRIADAEGVAALSMRRIATELDSGVMSLYRHVANKDALLTAITRAACDERPYPEPAPADWREAMRLAARLDWEVYCAHPWALVTSSSARLLRHHLPRLDGGRAGRSDRGRRARRSFSIAVWCVRAGVCTSTWRSRLPRRGQAGTVPLGLESRGGWDPSGWSSVTARRPGQAEPAGEADLVAAAGFPGRGLPARSPPPVVVRAGGRAGPGWCGRG